MKLNKIKQIKNIRGEQMKKEKARDWIMKLGELSKKSLKKYFLASILMINLALALFKPCKLALALKNVVLKSFRKTCFSITLFSKLSYVSNKVNSVIKNSIEKNQYKKMLLKIKNNAITALERKKTAKISGSDAVVDKIINPINTLKNKECNFGFGTNTVMKSLAIILLVLAFMPSVLAVSVSHPASAVYNGTFSGGNYYFPGNLSVGYANLWVDNTTGSVGIGTVSTASDATVHIKADSPTLKLEKTDTDSWSGIRFSRGATNDWFIGSRENGDGDGTDLSILSEEAGTEAIFIKGSSGNVGIGTTNPTKKLEVAGSINSTELNVSSNANFGYSTGKIGINNTNPSHNLQLQGTFNATDGSGAMIRTDGTGNVIIKLGS